MSPLTSKRKSPYVILVQRAFIILLTIFFIAFAWKFGRETRAGIENDVLARQMMYQTSETKNLGNLIRLSVGEVTNSLQTMAITNTVVNGDYATCDPLLKNLKQKFPIPLSQLTRLDARGIVICSSEPSTKGKSFYFYEHIKKQISDSSHLPVVSRIVQLEEGKKGNIGIHVSVPVTDTNLNYLGSLVAEVPLPSLYSDSFASYEMAPDAYLLLIDDNLDILYSSVEEILGQPLSKDSVQDKLGTNGDIKDLIFSLKNGISDFGTYKFKGNRDYLVSYSFVQVAQDRKFITLLAVPKDYPIKTVAPLISTFTIKVVIMIVMFALLILVAMLIETLRQKSVLNLRETERFKLAADYAFDLVIVTDPDGIILYANKAVERITGYRIEEIIGTKAGRLWGGLMPKDFYSELWQTLKDRKTASAGTIKNKRKSGEVYESEFIAVPLLEGGEVSCLVCVQKDMTHEKEVDTVKSEFISLASHQLRTPVSSVLWGLEMLLSGNAGKPNAKQNEILQNSYKAMHKMSEMLDNLLNVHKVETGRITVNPKSQSLEKLINSCIDELQHITLEKHQKIKIDNQLGKDEFVVDENILRTVYLNLLSNACKYSPENSEILIRLYMQHTDVISLIKDQGYGIPKDDQNLVFDKFFRSKNIASMEVNGTGLGLYLTKQIVNLIGGRIWFESTENQGTSFYFTFPSAGMPRTEGVVKLYDGSK